MLSERPGHLSELARNAVADGATLLVVVGGDGSVHEVADAVVGSNVDVALIARGTGWDFARSLGIPRRLDEAIRVAREGDVRVIDIGRATFRSWAGAEETSHFANVASAGMSGAIAQRANETSKALGGKASYLWATVAVFARWRNAEVRVTVDAEARVGRMHDVVVANGSSLAGGMRLCPDAEPDDGVFDTLLIGDLAKRDLVVSVPKLYRGTHLPHPRAELLRGRAVTVESAEPLTVQLDGEQPGTTPARFAVVPRALRMRVPRSR